MKTKEQIAETYVERIGHVYFRPLMYGGDGRGVELLLSLYHSFWAELLDQEDKLSDIIRTVMEEQKCGAFSFVPRYKYNQPNASEQELADYAVLQWIKISDRINLPIGYKSLCEIYSPLKENLQVSKRLQLLFQKGNV